MEWGSRVMGLDSSVLRMISRCTPPQGMCTSSKQNKRIQIFNEQGQSKAIWETPELLNARHQPLC